MPKIFYTELPPTEAALQASLESKFPNLDINSIFSFLTVRKLTTDLDITLDSYFAKYHLSVGRFTLLNLLSFFNDGLMPSELATKVGVTQATISGLINSLEKASYVSRETHQKDGRAFVIKLTPAGSELVDRICPEYYGRIEKILSTFDATERETMSFLVRKLIDRLPIINQAE